MKEIALILVIWIIGTIINLAVAKLKEGKVSRTEFVFAIWLGLVFPVYISIIYAFGKNSHKKVF